MAESTGTCWLGLVRTINCCWGSSGKGRCCSRSSKQIGQLEFPADGIQSNGKDTTSYGAGNTPSTPKVADKIRQASHLRVFSFSDLKAATRNFRPDSKLGVGGFGSVFKGWIDEHGTSAVKPGTGLTVAVKQLNHEGPQGHREWLAEVNFLGQFHHPNLVKLIGYCIEDEHRLLVYEFMRRGSLENHLFRQGVLPLSWAIRMKIALGAARGLAFLHGAKNSVIYRDFKTSNILLDSGTGGMRELWQQVVHDEVDGAPS